MTVTPPCDTASVTTQLRLLSTPETPVAPHSAPRARTRMRRGTVPSRPASPAAVRLNQRTRQIGQSGVAEARRRLAEIRATSTRAHELVKAS